MPFQLNGNTKGGNKYVSPLIRSIFNGYIIDIKPITRVAFFFCSRLKYRGIKKRVNTLGKKGEGKDMKVLSKTACFSHKHTYIYISLP